MSRDIDARAVMRATGAGYMQALKVVHHHRECGSLPAYIGKLAALGYVPPGSGLRCVWCLELLGVSKHHCAVRP